MAMVTEIRFLGMQYGVVQTELPWGLNLNETILPEVLSANGYATHMLGEISSI
jgi:arylsulfatase A-like enzyme